MKKLIFKSLLLSILIIIMLFFFGDYLTKINPFAGFVQNFNQSVNEGYEYDIFFYGSSKNYSTFNPRIFSEVLEVSCFNFGNNGQRLSTTIFVLEETLKKQKPKLLVIEIYDQSIRSPISKENISFQFNSYDAFTFSLNKFQYSLKNFTFKDLPFLHIAALRNHEGWKTIRENKIDAQNNSYLIEENNGYRGWQYVVKDAKKYVPLIPVHYKEGSLNIDILDLDQKNNLNEIISTIQKHNIPVLFVTAPSLRDLENKNYPDFSISLNNYLRKKNQIYLDLNCKIDSIKLNPDDFRDIIHLNHKGANKVSEYLANFINQKYSIGVLNTVEAKVERHITEGSFSKSSKFVGRKLINEVSLQRIDYINSGNGKMSVIMELDSIHPSLVDDYMIMFHAHPDDQYSEFLSDKAKEKGRPYEIWDFNPQLTLINNKYYVIHTIDTKIQFIKTTSIGIYSAKGYNGLLYDRITISF